jgi:hypothetical protein
MSLADPTPEVLMAYALGTLPAAETAAVQRWLLVQTDERVLEAYRALQAEADRRRSRLAHWAAHPWRARLERAVWRAQAHVTERLAILLEGDKAPRRPVFAPLGPSTGNEAGRRAVPVHVPSGSIVYLGVKPDSSGHLTAFGVDVHGGLHALCNDQIVAAGERVELTGFELEGVGDVLEVYLVLSSSAWIPVPAPTDDATWLAEVLDRIAARGDVSFARYVFMTSPSPDGKQL